MQQIVLQHYISWAERFSNAPPGNVSLFDGVPIVALPGEIFTETGLIVREAMGNRRVRRHYCDGNPATSAASEFVHGGYEVGEFTASSAC